MGERRILMVGTDLAAHGGISSVLRSYQDYGLFKAWGVDYVATYEAPGMVRQLRVFSAALIRILGLLLSRRVAVVHVHSASRGSFWRKSLVAALAWLCRVPYVFHIHSGEFPDFYARECGAAGQAWIRWILRHAGRVIVLSPHWRQVVGALEPRARVEQLGNPVHVPATLAPMRDPARTVLFLGRLQPKKGIFDLLRAIPAIRAAHPQTRFVLAGDGEMDAVRTLAAELGVSDAIEMPGWVDGEAKQRLLAQADIFVLPSHFEALSVGLLEAMSGGVPIVSTRVGGIPDLINHEAEGLLVAAGPGPALADAINQLLADPQLRQRLRAQAFVRVGAEYSFQAILRQLRGIYGGIGVAVGELPRTPLAAEL